jgi:hypothetical protein
VTGQAARCFLDKTRVCGGIATDHPCKAYKDGKCQLLTNTSRARRVLEQLLSALTKKPPPPFS